MGAVDFRVGGRIFATLAAVKKGYGNVMLSPDQQRAFLAELPDVFTPCAGKWGENGATHVVLSAATDDIVLGALQAAWKRRSAANASARTPRRKPPAPRGRGR
jgi:hypothetical protein